LPSAGLMLCDLIHNPPGTAPFSEHPERVDGSH
jgi:hypothetical protein